MVDLTLARGVSIRGNSIYIFYGKDDSTAFDFESKEEAEAVYENLVRVTGAENAEALATPRKKNARKIKKKTILQGFSKEMFEKFWSAYDKKHGKEDAKNSWDEMTEEEMKKAVEKAGEYRKSFGDDKTYMKYPGTWLNNRGWEDEIEKRGSRNIKSKSEKLAEKPKYVKPKYVKDDR